MFEQPSLTLIRSLLAGSSSSPSSSYPSAIPSTSSASEPFWNGQRSTVTTTTTTGHVHSFEFEPSTSAPVQDGSGQSVVTTFTHMGHWSSYPKIVSPDTPDTQLSESLSRPPSVQILTPPLTLSPSPSSPAVGSSHQPMSLATRRQIDEFEELIEKIDRLNGMQNDGEDCSRHSPFSRQPSDTPNLTALLVQNNNPQLFLDRPSVGGNSQLLNSCRSVRSRTSPHSRTRTSSSVIDDDFEILLEENPSLLDGPSAPPPQTLPSTSSSSSMMMMDTLEMCSRNSAPSHNNCTSHSSSMFNCNLESTCGSSSVGGHNVVDCSRNGQEINVKKEMAEGGDDDDDDVVECGRTDPSSLSVRQGFTSIPTRYFGPPTSLKSATMTTRTNLKQLLQMQQFHEMERKEQTKGSGMSTSPIGGGGGGGPPSSSSVTGGGGGGGTTGCNNGGGGHFATSTSVSVPMQPILPSRMEVPSEVLKVHSQLENPTRYHVQENRKRQVQEYLSTTQGNARSILAQSVPVGAAAMGAVGGAPGTSAPSMSNNNVASAPITTVARSPDSPNSVVLSSSAATSVTSEADVIESIMQLESSMDTDHATYLPQQLTLPATANFLDVLKMSSAKSCPPDVPVTNLDGLHLTNVQLHAIAKDRQKKDNHNMIERRRRFNINDRIKELGTLLPRSNDPYYDMIRIDRQNKGTILKATVDYVKQMRKELDRVKMELGEKDQENRKLRLQNVQLVAMHSHSSGSSGVEVSWPESVTGLSNAFTTKQELRIKEEPLDSSVDHFHQQVSPFDDLMDEDEPVHGDPLLSSSMLGNTL